MKRLYHGTIYDFDEIDLSAGKGYRDFGKGFYATAVPSHAERMTLRNKRIAEKRQSFLSKKEGVKLRKIVAYRYNLLYNEDVAGLNVKAFEKADNDWLRFMLRNRKCEGRAHDYDIVIGPTADAETVAVINEYDDELEESGYSDEICEKVIAALSPENLPKQYYFGTKKAVRTLIFDQEKKQTVG